MQSAMPDQSSSETALQIDDALSKLATRVRSLSAQHQAAVEGEKQACQIAHQRLSKTLASNANSIDFFFQRQEELQMTRNIDSQAVKQLKQHASTQDAVIGRLTGAIQDVKKKQKQRALLITHNRQLAEKLSRLKEQLASAESGAQQMERTLKAAVDTAHFELQQGVADKERECIGRLAQLRADLETRARADATQSAACSNAVLATLHASIGSAEDEAAELRGSMCKQLASCTLLLAEVRQQYDEQLDESRQHLENERTLHAGANARHGKMLAEARAELARAQQLHAAASLQAEARVNEVEATSKKALAATRDAAVSMEQGFLAQAKESETTIASLRACFRMRPLIMRNPAPLSDECSACSNLNPRTGKVEKQAVAESKAAAIEREKLSVQLQERVRQLNASVEQAAAAANEAATVRKGLSSEAETLRKGLEAATASLAAARAVAANAAEEKKAAEEERERREAAAAATIAALESRVAAREAELAECGEELEQTKEELGRASRRIVEAEMAAAATVAEAQAKVMAAAEPGAPPLPTSQHDPSIQPSSQPPQQTKRASAGGKMTKRAKGASKQEPPRVTPSPSFKPVKVPQLAQLSLKYLKR